ncbi:MAG: DsbA family protein [Erythrobacter sp.]
MTSPLKAPFAAAGALSGIAALAAAIALPAAAQSRAAQDLSSPGSAFATGLPGGNWQAEIKRTERGHLIGNPKAAATMIEFISYTCPHCASFTDEGEPGLDLVLVSPGKMSLEVRPVIRNPIDLTVSMLAACGDVAGFKNRHRMFMNAQSQWLDKARAAPRSQVEIWFRGDANARMNMASALGLADMLANQGLSRSAINACLMDDKAAARLLENSDADRAEFAFPGTPSFALDGELIKGVADWKGLYPVLSSHFAEAPPARGELPPRK